MASAEVDGAAFSGFVEFWISVPPSTRGISFISFVSYTNFSAIELTIFLMESDYCGGHYLFLSWPSSGHDCTTSGAVSVSVEYYAETLLRSDCFSAP